MEITLVSCCYEKGNFSYPLGALCVLHALKEQGYHARLLDCTLTDDPALAADKATGEAIGLSVYLWNRPWFDRFLHRLEETGRKPLLFAGGTEVTANPHSFDPDRFVFLSLGEGEESVPLALSRISEGKEVSGNGIMTKGMPSAPSCPEDLSRLSSVLLSHTADQAIKKADTVLWELTRGCPFHCAFCFESKGVGNVRHFPMERIVQELDYLLSHHVRSIFVLDPTFNMDKDRTKEILSLFVRKASHVHFTFENRAELLDAEIADLFAQLDCSLQIGMQSSNAKALAMMERNVDQERFMQKVSLLVERNITFGLDLIIALPGDTLHGFEKSLDDAISLKPSNIDIFLLSVLPGTTLYDKADAYGLVRDTDAPYLVRETPTMGRKEIAQALRLKKACDLFYTKGQSYMWMQLLCKSVSLPPHAMLSLFADYLDGEDESKDIYELQDGFVRKLLKETGKKRLIPVLTSYMELYQGIAYLLETGESPVVSLRYDPNDLADLEKMDVDEFLLHHRENPQELEIGQEEDGSIRFS